MTPVTSLSTDVREVVIVCGNRRVRGNLTIPDKPRGVVGFAHGSGSGRFSPRNQHVAEILQSRGLATLLMDLLEEDEAENRDCVFEIPRLVDRLEAAGDWLSRENDLQGLPLGYFGASTGAAAALAAAARRPQQVRAVVSRGGRPDLVWDLLPRITVPTLLIVGGADDLVLELNRDSFDRLHGPRELVVIPNATHLFPEPGALDQVARLAGNWFLTHFGVHPQAEERLDQPQLRL